MWNEAIVMILVDYSGSTGSNGTGPNNGRGGSGDYYIYAEARFGEPNKTFILESDVLSSSITSLSFYYHAHGGIWILNIDYSTNSGSWTVKYKLMELRPIAQEVPL